MDLLSFAREPALIISAVDAVLVLLVTFGVPIAADQKTAIDGVLAAVLAIVAGIAIRSQVTPVATLSQTPAQPVAPRGNP